MGLVHLAPLVGVLGAARLEGLYGVAIEDPNLLILMRHRAVLFGMLGAFVIVAAFVHRWQLAAFATAFVSLVSFLGLAVAVGEYNGAIERVIAIDVMTLAILTIGVVVRSYAPPPKPSRIDRRVSGPVPGEGSAGSFLP